MSWSCNILYSSALVLDLVLFFVILSVTNTGILIFLLAILTSVRCFWGVFEHSLTKSVLFQLGLTELFPQHIPHIESSSELWDEHPSFYTLHRILLADHL